MSTGTLLKSWIVLCTFFQDFIFNLYLCTQFFLSWACRLNRSRSSLDRRGNTVRWQRKAETDQQIRNRAWQLWIMMNTVTVPLEWGGVGYPPAHLWKIPAHQLILQSHDKYPKSHLWYGSCSTSALTMGCVKKLPIVMKSTCRSTRYRYRLYNCTKRFCWLWGTAKTMCVVGNWWEPIATSPPPLPSPRPVDHTRMDS